MNLENEKHERERRKKKKEGKIKKGDYKLEERKCLN